MLFAGFLCCCAIATVSAQLVQYGSSGSWKVDVGNVVDAALMSIQIGISASGPQVNGTSSGVHQTPGNDTRLRTCASLLLVQCTTGSSWHRWRSTPATHTTYGLPIAGSGQGRRSIQRLEERPIQDIWQP